MRAGVLPSLEEYEILAEAGSGGMGTVYRARDRRTEAIVALKVLRDPQRGDAERFLHEARILANLSHNHIVRSEGYGHAPSGEPYIVMEWLEGETLDKKLDRGRLTAEETMDLAFDTANALGVAHAKGILHRDIKPSNIFLVGGDVRASKILDFGIARQGNASRNLTRTGNILGTPGYMAPEQARGELTLGPEVDVFALGCVLFECLAGQPAFQGMHPMALLAKLLMEDPPRLSEVCPDAPRSLALLIDRMLSKTPSARPRNGAAIANELSVREEAARSSIVAPASSALLPAISTRERRLVSIIAIAPLPTTLPTNASIEATLEAAGEQTRKLLENVRVALRPIGASVDVLADGTILVVLNSNGDHPAEQVGRAAQVALWLRQTTPKLAMALVTGRGESTGHAPLGALLERAADILLLAPPLEKREARGIVLMDDATRALLDARFDVIEGQGAAVLRLERPVGEQPRTLLGKPTPFVGRDRELRRIIEVVEETFEEKCPTAILVEAEAGVGKSRLRQELLAQLRERFEGLIVAVGRGDPVSGGSAYATFSSLFRTILGIAEGDPIEKQREFVRRLVCQFIQDGEQNRVLEFMGELIGVPFPDEGSPKLRAARQSPQIMADQIEAAYIDFTRARAATRPAVLVFEDLHWCDSASIRLVDAVLRDLEAQYVVIAFTRPDIHERFPKLWAGRQVHPIRLSPLSRKAAEHLARAVLDENFDQGKVNAIVERASGNAFFLEELIRAVANGYEDALPETVLGVLETRLSALADEPRRFLRAASVLGESFWKNGVLAMLGQELPKHATDGVVQLLLDQEVIVVRRERRFANEEEYAFRHALLREAAYEMLTERDRTAGHRLAGEWLERVGEQDPSVLATHFDKGDHPERAAIHYARAAEQSLRGSDYENALRLAERGAAMTKTPELVADLQSTIANAAFWTADYDRAISAAKEALAHSKPGSRSDCHALGHAIAAGVFRQGTAGLDEHLDRLLATDPVPDALGVLAQAINSAMMALVSEAPRSRVERCMQRLEELAFVASERDPTVKAWLEYVRGTFARNVENAPWSALTHDSLAAEHFEIAGDRGFLPYAKTFVGLDWALLGEYDRAQAQIERALAKARPRSLQANLAAHFMAFVLLAKGDLEAARSQALDVLAAAATRGDRLLFLLASLVVAEAEFDAGNFEAADAQTAALEATTSRLPYQGMWLSTLRARIRLEQKRPELALQFAEDALATALRLDRGYFGRHSALLLTRADALFALGRIKEANDALQFAQKTLFAQAERIQDGSVRRSFFQNIKAHARIANWVGPFHDETSA